MPAHSLDPVRYLICGSPRSGTTLLCTALQATELAGRPGEYFEPSRLQQRGLLDLDPGVVVRRILDEAATPNGVSGAKMMWAQLVRLGSLDQSGAFHEQGFRDFFGKLPPLRYVWVSRRDKVRQAVSYARALQSGLWLRNGDPTSIRRPVFHWDEIDSHVRDFQQQDRWWSLFFEAAGVTPLRVDYEDLADNYGETVRRACAFLDVEAASISAPTLQRQADRLTEEWVDRYINSAERDRGESPGYRLDPALVLQLLRSRWRSLRRRLSA